MSSASVKVPVIPQEKLNAKLAEQAKEDGVGLEAAATPLPGATREAFSIVPPIPVGEYKVRRFVDGDIENLQTTGNSFAGLVLAVMSGNGEEKTFTPRGKDAWELCWMMTRDIDEVDKMLAESGIDGVKAAGRKEFRNSQMGDLSAVIQAVIAQFSIYSSPVLGYGVKPEKSEGEKSHPPQT